MKNILRKNNKGITLISLVVMIIIILILAAVGTNTGVSVIRESKYHRAVSEMKVMQTKINEMYEDHKSGDDSIATLGSNIDDVPSSLKSKAETAIRSVDGNLNKIEDFRYYSADYIKNTLDVDGVEGDYLVNIKTREVISVDGIKNEGEMYYSLSQIKDEQFNVEYVNPTVAYSPDGGKYILPKNVTNAKTLNMNIELSLQDIPNSMTADDLTIKYNWSTSKDTEPTTSWTVVENGATIEEDGNSNIKEAGEYYLWTKVEYKDGKVLNTTVSKKYTVKNEYDIKVAVIFDKNGGTGDAESINVLNEEQYGELPTPTREGYIFTGWYTDITGGTKVESTDILELNEENLPPTQPQSQTLYAGWEEDAAYFNGNSSSFDWSNITSADNIKRFEKYTGNDSDVQTLINNGTAVKFDDNTTIRSIYVWFDNNSQTIYWWTDAYKTYLLDKSHYMWRGLNNIEYIDVNGIDTSKVTTMAYMFEKTGYNSNTFEIVGLNTFDTSNVTTMEYMFRDTGYNATTWNIGNLDNWDTSKATNMLFMFSYAGYTATSWNIGNLDNWDTSNVTNMDSMFRSAGYSSQTFDIGNIGKWNVSNITTMRQMFIYSGYTATSWNIGNLDSWDTSNVTNMVEMFTFSGYNTTTWDIGNLNNWNTSKVTNMQSMFSTSGYKATVWNAGNLSNWNTSNVTNMDSMFHSAGYSSQTFDIGNIGKWNVSNVTNMRNMFVKSGYSATTWNIGNLDNWDTSNVMNMQNMFDNSGYNATTWNIGNLDNWNTSNVTKMEFMFRYAGYRATTWNIGNLASWNTSSVTTMLCMFYSAGYSATEFDIGNLNAWTTSSVTTMKEMFYAAGRNATTWNIGNLDNWNTSNVTNMQSMFNTAGYSAETFNIGTLNNWNTSNVTIMVSMFHCAGYSATTWNSFGTLKIYASNINYLFKGCKNANGTLNIYNNPTNYSETFNGAATSGSGITVNYKNSVTNIDNIIATKSATSQIIKGNVLN